MSFVVWDLEGVPVLYSPIITLLCASVDVLAEQPILLKILMLHPPLPRTHTRTITTTIGDNWTIHNILV